MTLLWLASGLALLVLGADLLVRGAARLAASFGVSALVIGLTVVAYGTSAPEMAVSTAAAVGGRADIALGNVVGSNTFNVLVILGLSALITPLAVAQQLIRLDVPLMLAVSLLAWWLASDGAVSRIDGALLATGAVAYTLFAVRSGRREPDEVRAEYEGLERSLVPSGRRAWLADAALVAGGLVLLVVGARWLVESAVAIARALGLSELLIGLTIVAAGTSLPEVATSIVAALRGERDIAVGNVVGSNLFNLMAVLGLAALVSPAGVAASPQALARDLPVMVVVALACVPVVVSGQRIARWEGLLLVLGYVLYVAYLVLAARSHAAAGPLGGVLVWLVVPAMLVALAAPLALERRRPTSRGG